MSGVNELAESIARLDSMQREMIAAECAQVETQCKQMRALVREEWAVCSVEVEAFWAALRAVMKP
jgi:hypothetical protein